MRTLSRRLGHMAGLFAIFALMPMAALLSACQPKQGTGDAIAASEPGAVLLIAPEDVQVVGPSPYAAGPMMTGSMQPERRADLRAEVAAVVLRVLKENGQAVRQGDVLVRLDETAIRDSLQSAEAASRAALQAWDQAQRQYERIKALHAQGMSSAQALDDAEARRNAALSERSAADARTVAARQQLQRTQVRAPFDGIVSEREVFAGDTAAIGKALLKVIDPSSMRFEGRVTADSMKDIQVGQTVLLRVNGFGHGDVVGTVRHMDAAADAQTRQVAVIVGFAAGTAPRIAGLYAEGRAVVGQSSALLLPESAVVKESDKAYVWKIDTQRRTLVKTPVVLGERDARRGQVVVTLGVVAGDKFLRVPGSTWVNGQRLAFVSVPPAAAASVSSTRTASAPTF